ncbi:hypothetical protein JCM3774_006872 [Rhodotorula dairenensis]
MQATGSSYYSHGSASHAGSSTSTGRRPPAAPTRTTFEPLTAHDRLQRMHALKSFYESADRMPAKPRSRHELDVLKERHQFVRDSRVDPATLSWEDQLASKFYDSLFKEYAVVNLKHYKSGAVALRWRTEDEVLSGIGHLTCGSLRCRFHEPSPRVLASLEDGTDPAAAAAIAGGGLDDSDEVPLVEARLEELQVPFGYVEDGEKKSALVKVVLCRDCAKKLRYGKQRAKEERDKRSGHLAAAASSSLDRSSQRDTSTSPRLARRSDADAKQRTRVEDDAGGDDDDDSEDEGGYRPELPPDLPARPAAKRSKRAEAEQVQQWRADSSRRGSRTERRRSASPRRHRRAEQVQQRRADSSRRGSRTERRRSASPRRQSTIR